MLFWCRFGGVRGRDLADDGREEEGEVSGVERSDMRRNPGSTCTANSLSTRKTPDSVSIQIPRIFVFL
jgi:hypothetical protein